MNMDKETYTDTDACTDTGDSTLAAIARSSDGIGASEVARDVSAQRHFAQTQRENDLKVRAIYDSALQFIGMLAIDGTVIDANATALAFIDQPLSAVVGKLFWDCPWWTQPGAKAACRDAVLRAAAGETVRMQTQHVAPDGQTIEVDFSLQPLRDRTGRITHLIPEGRDITALRTAERELLTAAEAGAQHDAMFRFLVEGVKDYAIFMLDPDGRVKTWNSGAERLKGYSAAEIIGQHFSIFYPPEEIANGKTDRELKFAVEHGQYIEDGWRVRKDGSLFFANVTISAIKDRDGKLLGFAKVSKDLTERVSAEAALRNSEVHLKTSEAMRASETRFRFMADNMPQIIWTATPDGSVDYYNNRWFEFTGLTFEQTRAWGWKPVLHPEDLDQCVQKWTQAVSSGNEYEAQFRFKRGSDGAYRWHLARAIARTDDSGKIAEWIGTLTDVHDQMMDAAELKESRDLLESRVNERTGQLGRQKQFIEAVLDNISDGIVVCDTQRRITYLNPEIKQMLGVYVLADDMSPEWANQNLSLFDPASGALLSWEQRPLWRALKGETVNAFEAMIKPSHGAPRRLLISAVP